jgi:hypothetical protein
MDVNGDLSKRVMLHSDEIEWEDSPMQGVDRRRLDRIENKAGRVTTIVRYALGSSFSPHVHPHGEEFIVLDVIFEDDYGNWPTGSYIRNPPNSAHKPSSEAGCVIFVKLAQMQPDDRTFIHADINKLGSVQDANRNGVKVSPLFKDSFEDVRLEYWEPDTNVSVDASGGAEFLVLKGSFTEGGDELRKESWLRIPVGTQVSAVAGKKGAKLWIKSGHLISPVNAE